MASKKRIESLLPFVYFEDEICRKEEAHVSLGSNSLQYGTSCFGGIRAYLRDGTLRFFRLCDHFDRLMNGAKILGFDFSMEFEDFRSVLFELARKNAPKTDIYIRPFIFSNDEFLPPRLPGLT
ncbi:MAG: branched-chain amino acid aminotransferase, partial [Chlamydiia bacterium]|nr:branched-chain amino acid aminotransferase [Chlamydiia bacterium]